MHVTWWWTNQSAAFRPWCVYCEKCRKDDDDGGDGDGDDTDQLSKLRTDIKAVRVGKLILEIRR
jgi:hypothetical protein